MESEKAALLGKMGRIMKETLLTDTLKGLGSITLQMWISTMKGNLEFLIWKAKESSIGLTVGGTKVISSKARKTARVRFNGQMVTVMSELGKVVRCMGSVCFTIRQKILKSKASGSTVSA